MLSPVIDAMLLNFPSSLVKNKSGNLSDSSNYRLDSLLQMCLSSLTGH